MKSRLKAAFRNMVNNDMLWPIIKPFAKLGFLAYHNRKKQSIKVNYDIFPYSLFNKKEVLHGPFKGMKYPSHTSVGSVFCPKLLGSYEKELHNVIDNFLLENYTEVIDVGCAEGYYAVGLGMKFKNNTMVYAYDTDETARKLCYEMAKLNHVDEKIVIKETCTAEELETFKFTGKGLIICDCEGYEQQLFNDANVKNLTNCDLLIETHDFIDLSISQDLVKLFDETHHIHVVKSVDDIEKAKTYSYEETNALSLVQKLELFREWRPTIMEWLVCTPKT